MNPNLMPAVLQCLMAIVHRAFETALSWLEAQICETGDAAEVRESTLVVHACFLIMSLPVKEEHIRDVSVNLLSQLRERFPQILWKSSCLDSLLFSVNGDPPSSLVNDPASVASVRSLYQSVVKEWIVDSLSYAPCTTQGLLQEQLCKANTWQKAQPTTDVVSLLSEIKIGTGKTDCWKGKKTANIPAVMASAAAASGGNLKSTEAFNNEPVHFGFVVSKYLHESLNLGGISCIKCIRETGTQALKLIQDVLTKKEARYFNNDKELMKGTFRWHICFNFVVLRMISFQYDYYSSDHNPYVSLHYWIWGPKLHVAQNFPHMALLPILGTGK
ncbi:unnamed protein product [Lactuca saligna]|uniref:PI4-kinase N-terminal domain-containing protein n=1 Tax=Lactuca saligna TaxID=75948 RepID=A0AA35UTZ5_LACSI|nr:unnamed protein product [Lactuca saligna]